MSDDSILAALSRLDAKMDDGLQRLGDGLQRLDDDLRRLDAKVDEGLQRLDGDLRRLDAKVDDGLQRLDGDLRRLDAKVDEGLQRLDGDLRRLDAKVDDGLQRLDDGFQRLEADQVSLRKEMAGFRTGVMDEFGKTRGVIMEAVEVLQNSVTDIRADIAVNFGQVDQARRVNDNPREELRGLNDVVARMMTLILRLQTEVAELKGRPAA